MTSRNCAAGYWRNKKVRRTEAAVEFAARSLLARDGVLFCDLVARESNIPR
jgi:hypothetical protein